VRLAYLKGPNSMKKTILAGLLAVGGLMISPVGIANADQVLVNGNYATLTACQADGPHVEVDHPGNFTHFQCSQHDDGLWYLYLSN
jgi:hypothetical protein